MSQAAFNLQTIAANLVTEDDEPVDNLFSEKNQRLLTTVLYDSWQPPQFDDATENDKEPRKFTAAANVGIFFSAIEPPLVPDVFLSLDVEPNAEWLADEHRSYLVWNFGKVPEVAVEIVSNRKGGEMEKKMRTYARWGIDYYVVFDPFGELRAEKLSVYEFGFGKRYRRRTDFVLPDLNLSLTLWRGAFEGLESEWLRWADHDGNLILTGTERAGIADERAERLAAKLREMGINPEDI